MSESESENEELVRWFRARRTGDNVVERSSGVYKDGYTKKEKRKYEAWVKQAIEDFQRQEEVRQAFENFQRQEEQQQGTLKTFKTFETTRHDGSNRYNGGSVIRENFLKTVDGKNIPFEYEDTSTKRTRYLLNNGAWERVYQMLKNVRPKGQQLVGRSTELMFTNKGTPIQTKRFAEHTKEDQLAILTGEAVCIDQVEKAVACQLAQLRQYKMERCCDTIRVPCASWPRTGHQTRYLQDIMNQPFRNVKLRAPDEYCTLIRDPIPIKIHEGIMLPYKEHTWLDSFLTIPAAYCCDPQIRICFQPSPTWLTAYTKGWSTVTIKAVRLYKTPTNLKTRRTETTVSTTGDTRELLIQIRSTHKQPKVLKPTHRDHPGPMGYLYLVSRRPSIQHAINIVNVQLPPSTTRKAMFIPATTQLPYITVPLANQTGETKTVKGILDTGTCMNLGRYEHWVEFARNFPSYVGKCEKIDTTKYEEIQVYGPLINAKALTVTHYIDLCTPFRHGRKTISIRVGLVQGNVPNLIVGLPFIMRSKLSISLTDKRAFSALFNKTFQLEFLKLNEDSGDTGSEPDPEQLFATTDQTLANLLKEYDCPTQNLSKKYKKVLSANNDLSPIQRKILQAHQEDQTKTRRTTYDTFMDKEYFTKEFAVHAASAATKEELEQAKKLREAAPGTKPVETERKIWRPQVTSQYREPDCIPDPSSDMEILYKDFGKPIWAKKSKLGPRDDIIEFSKEQHQEEFDRNIQWRECLPKYKEKILPLLLEHWDVFAEEGVRKHIRGVSFHVDTGETTPICVKSPRYGPHESRVINALVEKLEKNGLVEDDDGPWGALIVLAAKPNQEHVHWSQYIWRLCVSYRKLNAVTRPYTFPIIRCDDAVKAIGDRRYYITMDLDSGYWQIEAEASSRAKLAFFTPTGKKRWTVMPMGATNAHPVFVALISKFKQEWDAKAERRGLKRCISQVIVDDIILAAYDPDTLIGYFKCVLEVLQHYRVTAKLRKCRFFVPIAEFVGLDVHPDGNSPAASKNKAFKDLSRPYTFTDLNMLIGCFGFYQEHLPLFEVRLDRWRQIQKLRPPKGTAIEEDAKILEKEWKEEDDKLLEELKAAILSFPILRRPNPELRFYLKTDWSKNAMGAALLQPDQDDQRALEAMHNEETGEKCMFDLTKSGIRLYPLAFISRRTSEPEKSYHSYVGEACTGVWAIEKFRPYLFGREFTWLTDCSGVKKFFDGNDVPTHMIQRWRMQLLRYDFTIVHRPGRMMFECDMLSRYNQATEAWRENQKEQTQIENETNGITKDQDQQSTAIPVSFSKIKFVGQIKSYVSAKRQYSGKMESEEDQEEMRLEALTEEFDDGISTWMWGPGILVLNQALNEVGLDMTNSAVIGPFEFEEPSKATQHHYYSWEEAQFIAKETKTGPHWLFVTRTLTIEEWDEIQQISYRLITKGLEAIVIASPERISQNILSNWARNLGWQETRINLHDSLLGGGTDIKMDIIILSEQVHDETLENIQQALTERRQHTVERHKAIRECLDNDERTREDFIEALDQRAQTIQTKSPFEAKTLSYAQINNTDWIPVYDPDNPLPSLRLKNNVMPTGEPLIETQDGLHGKVIRPLRWTEVAKAIGLDEGDIQDITEMTKQRHAIWPFLSEIVPKGICKSIITILHSAKSIFHKNNKEKRMAMQASYMSPAVKTLVCAATNATIQPKLTTKVTRWTTIPLPSHKKWVDAIQDDPNLSLIVEAIVNNTELDRHQLQNKMYFTPFDKGLFEIEDGILYYAKEPTMMNVRQLRRRVVPKELQHVIIIAFHSTPLAGHVGFYKTFWRIASRYWWPTYYKDIREAVQGCAHCVLTNATGHKAQQIWKALEFDVPFDVISMDIWSPGEVQTKFRETKVLTSLDTMTGFASADFLVAGVDSEQLARRAYASFFVPNGLPKLILIDAGSENKGVFVNMCATLGIKYHMVSPDEHNGILCERFHRYLNKVEKIHAADTQSHTQWVQGTLFATYAWNAAPIDGTNIIRSFAAKARVFPFPIEIAQDSVARTTPGEGEMAIEHVETIFPLWAKQNMLLQILQEQRRERHRNLKNDGQLQREFSVGDLVIVQKQVKSKTINDVALPAKQQIAKYKGPYKVIEKIGTKSYQVQRIPTVQGTRKPGKLLKFSASNMTKIPSTLVVHKKLDTQDTRLAAMERPLVHNPLEQALGFHQYGKYIQTPDDTKFAYDRVEDLWQDELDDNSESTDGDATDEEDEDMDEPHATTTKETIETDVNETGTDNPLQNKRKTRERIQETQETQKTTGTTTRAMKRVKFDETKQHPVRTKKPEPTSKTIRIGTPLENPILPMNATKEQLYETTEKSRGKMFIIWYEDDWYVVEVIWEKTVRDKAKDRGEYFVQWYMRKDDDASKYAVKDCRFWPLVKKFDGHGWFTDEIRFVSPNKLDRTMGNGKWKDYGLYHKTVDLWTTRLVGPFSLESRKVESRKRKGKAERRTEPHYVPERIWTELRRQAALRGLDVKNLTEICKYKPHVRNNPTVNTQP